MLGKYDNIIVHIVSDAMVPFIQLFALYVIMHGHSGPGGGFQGGVLMASSIILLRLYLGKEASHRKFPPKLTVALATIGMIAFILVGLIPLATGGVFLDYAYLPIPGVSGAALRAIGITIVELAIALVVFGSLVSLFDNLAGGKQR